MRKAGYNPGVHVANVVGDALHDILHPHAAADDAIALIASRNLKHRLALPRRRASVHERRSTAHHEGGHVMVAFTEGAQHIEACVRDDATGVTIARTIESAEAGITYSLAGPFAEIKFNPPSIHNFTHPACADFLIARTKIDALNASRLWPQLTYRTAAKNAMRFVEAHWQSIRDLALVLEDAGELDDQAIRIFATCRK